MKPHCSWSDFAVPVFDGQFDTKIKSGRDYKTKPLGALLNAPPAKKPKQKAPAFIPSTYHAFDARRHETQRKKGRFVALTGDIDDGNIPLEKIATLVLRFFGVDKATFIFSTASASEALKRWRVIIPLLNPVPFSEWLNGQNAFFNLMEAQGVPMDRTLARAAQPVYLPNVPPDKREKNGQPLFYEAHISGEVGFKL